MRPPRIPTFGLRAPRLKTIGPGSVSSLLKIALDIAYVLLWVITAAMVVAFIACLFIPMDTVNVTVSDDAGGGKQMPLARPLLLFGVGAFVAYFGGFVLILRLLRKVFRTLTLGDPFQPENIGRLRQVGLILAVVTVGVWAAQILVARVVPGVMEPQGVFDLLTPIFSVLVVFVLAEVFREGARLRRESELTI